MPLRFLEALPGKLDTKIQLYTHLVFSMFKGDQSHCVDLLQ